MARVQVCSTGKTGTAFLQSPSTVQGNRARGAKRVTILLWICCLQEGLPREFTGGAEDSQDRSWDILPSFQLLQRVPPPWLPPAAMGSSKTLSCLLLSGLISAGSTLLSFLLPQLQIWPCWMSVHLPPEACHPSLFPPWLSSFRPAGSPGPDE